MCVCNNKTCPKCDSGIEAFYQEFFTDGGKGWWINGKEVKCKSQEEFEKFLKLKAFW